jgi:hypothetical protein
MAGAGPAVLSGEKAGSRSDNYIRTTVYLVTVLFLAGLGGILGTASSAMTLPLSARPFSAWPS